MGNLTFIYVELTMQTYFYDSLHPFVLLQYKWQNAYNLMIFLDAQNWYYITIYLYIST